MPTEAINLSPSRALAARVIFEAMKLLTENGGEMSLTEIMKRVEDRVELDDWARAVYEKTRYTRWQSILHFFSIDCVKAGFLIKRRGVWFITPEGEQAILLGPVGLLQEATRRYREWDKQRERVAKPDNDRPEEEIDDSVIAPESTEVTLEEIQAQARDAISKAIDDKLPYEFQDLAAALLRAMGYYTPFIAPTGKDGGIDIIAYRDQFGTQLPQIKAQVKHKEMSTPVKDIRELIGVLQAGRDVGIFFSTSDFTSEAKNTARNAQVHVELIDRNRFIDLWVEHFDKMSDEDKALLRLVPVYFVAPTE